MEEKKHVVNPKEFWEILEKSGLVNKKIYGYDGLLNTISLLLDKASENAKDEDIKRIYKAEADVIFDELWDRGYYK